MSETLAKDRFAMSQAFFSTPHLPLDVLHVKTTNILEFNSLEQIPDPFLRIQFGSIGRQTFEMDAFGSAFGQEIFDGLTAMDRGSVPDHQQLARDLTQEQLQEADGIWALVRMVLRLHEDPSLWGNTTHGREMIPGQWDLQDGRLTHGCIGAKRHRQQVKSRLIYENDRPLFVFRLFFSSSQRCSFQPWIAASSRWVAFWMGFC